MPTEQVIFGGTGQQTYTPTGSYVFGITLGLVGPPSGFVKTGLLAPSSGYIHSFRVELGTAPGSGKGWIFEFGNNVDGWVAVTVDDTATVGSNLADNIHITAHNGILLRVKRKTGDATPASTLRWSFRWRPDTDNETLLGSLIDTVSYSSSATEYGSFAGQSRKLFSSAPNAAIVIPTAGTIKLLTIQDTASYSGSESRKYQVQFTSSPTDTTFINSPLFVTFDSPGTFVAQDSGAATQALAAGSRIVLKVVPSNDPPSVIPNGMGLIFVPTNSGEFILPMGTDRQPSASVDNYITTYGGPPSIGQDTAHARYNTTESDHEIMAMRETGSTDCIIKRIRTFADGSTGVSQAKWWKTLRVNGVDSALSSQDNDGAGAFVFDADVRVSDGDMLTTEIHPISGRFGVAPSVRTFWISYMAKVEGVPTVHVKGSTTILGKTTIGAG